MKKKWIVDAPILNMALRIYGVHFHHVFDKTVIGVKICRIPNDNQQSHNAGRKNGNDFSDSKKQCGGIDTVLNEQALHLAEFKNPLSLGG